MRALTERVACPSADAALDVVDHLRGMGETNAQLTRRGFVRRDTALATAAAYESLFAEESEDGEVGVPATFQARSHALVTVRPPCLCLSASPALLLFCDYLGTLLVAGSNTFL